MSFSRADKDGSFLLLPENRSKLSILVSPRSRINRKSIVSGFDSGAVLNCVRQNLGEQTYEILKNIIDSSTEVGNSKYRTLYQRERTNHEATELNRQELAARI